MRKTLLLLVILLVLFFFSGMVSADETKAKEKMIQGKISKVDCDKAMITISGVKKLRSSDKKILPDVTLKLTDKTKLTGVKECKEIKTGTVVYFYLTIGHSYLIRHTSGQILTKKRNH